VSKFRVNSLSIVYHCANLPALRGIIRRRMGLSMKERLIGVADDRMTEMVSSLLYRLMFG